MLDLNHPESRYIFEAAVLMGDVWSRAKEMSVSPSVIRGEHLEKCLPRFDELRVLARDHFSEKVPYIHTVVDEFEFVIRLLAGLHRGQITEDHRDGEGICQVCKTTITKDVKQSHDGVVEYISAWCEVCSKPFLECIFRLDTNNGFGTWAI